MRNGHSSQIKIENPPAPIDTYSSDSDNSSQITDPHGKKKKKIIHNDDSKIQKKDIKYPP